MKFALKTMTAAPMVALLATTALAADKQNPFSVRGGLFYPTSSDTRDNTKNTGFGLGLSYELPSYSIQGLNGAVLNLELDGTWVGSSGNKLEAFDLMVTGRWYGTGMKAGSQSIYYGFGVGLTRQKGETTTTVSNGSGGTTTTVNSETKTSIAAKVLVGTAISKQAFIELGFRFAPSVNSLNANGLSLQLGVKF
ncbi:MAG: outer membrane beta-barrel protein [Armatimonadetes bacterium]|nr:outer membrane beta-barrel protein [Armatimonadota bacterium]